MSSPLTLAISTCPNDTFIFHGLVHGLVDMTAFADRPPQLILEDVEACNCLALQGRVDICKVSAAIWPALRDRYELLHSGAALGRGNGPVLVTRADNSRDAGFESIAIPGEHTTAARLLERYGEPDARRLAMRFDRIPKAVLDRKADAGVLIHEGRFTFASQGLRLVRDLGAWWEERFGLPLPLGCIVARRDLGAQRVRMVDAAVRQSLERANRNPEGCMDWVRSLARELDEEAIRQHIETFVTAWSLDMGHEGREAIATLCDAT